MADARRSLDLIVAAHDDTAGGLASASRNIAAFRRRMETQQRQEQASGGLGGFLPKFAIAAATIETMTIAAQEADQQFQKFFDHTVTGSEAIQQTLAQTAIKLPGVATVFKPVVGLVGTLVGAFQEFKGVSHAVAQQNLFNAFNFAKETEAIVNLGDGAMQAAKDLHALASDIGLKGLEKQFREIDRQIEDRVKQLSAAAQAVLANPDASADQREAAQGAIARIGEEGENARNAAKAEAQKQNNQAEVDRERTHQLDLAQIGDEGRAAALVEAGRDADAAVVIVKQKYDRMTVEEKARADQEARENPERQVEIASLSAKKVEAIESRRAEDIAILRRNEDRVLLQDHQHFVSDVEDLNVQTAATDLRNRHRESEAALLELRRAHQKELEELDRQSKEKIERLNQVGDETSQQKAAEERIRAVQRAAALEERFTSQQTDLQRQAQEEAATRQETIEHNIAMLRINALKEEGELGNQLSATEAQRLERVEKYAEQQRNILQMRRQEKDLTDEQKKQLDGALKSTDAMQAAAKKGLLAGVNNSFTSPTLPEGQERGLTGLAQANREAIIDDSRRQAVAQIEVAKNTAHMEKDIARMKEIAESMLTGKVWNIIPVS